MKKNLFFAGAFAMAAALSLAACSDNDEPKTSPDDDVVISETELTAAVSRYVDAVVVPTYAELSARNAELHDAVTAFRLSPSDANFKAVCEAWLAAREPWESSEAFLFGPVDSKNLDPNMDTWPLDVEEISRILESEDWGALEWSDDDGDDNIEAAQNVRGFHTLEYLIFKDGVPRTTTATSGTDDPYTLEYASADVKAWGNYMEHVARLLQSDAADLYDYWTESYTTDDYSGGASYGTIFKTHDGTLGFNSALNCVEQMIDGCTDIASEVGSAKIGDPYNLYVSGRTHEALYAVESWFSWHSRDDYANNIRSIRNVYYGSRDGSVHSSSLSAIMAKANADLDNKVKNAISDAINAILAIPQPFRNNISSAEAAAAMDACGDLESVLNDELKPYLLNHTK